MPKGVPTKATYAEKGEQAPRFTQAMFGNNQNGAIATAVYYLAAQNWSLALNDNLPVDLVCSSTRCVAKEAKFKELRGLGEHIVGGRMRSDLPQIKLAVIRGAQWLYQVTLTTDRYRVIDSSGSTVGDYPATKDVRTNIYLKWAGKLWTVTLQSTTPH